MPIITTNHYRHYVQDHYRHKCKKDPIPCYSCCSCKCFEDNKALHFLQTTPPLPNIAGEGFFCELDYFWWFLGGACFKSRKPILFKGLDYFPNKNYFFPKYFWILKIALLVAWLQNEIVLKFLDFRPFQIEVTTFIQLFIQILTYSNRATINFSLLLLKEPHYGLWKFSVVNTQFIPTTSL